MQFVCLQSILPRCCRVWGARVRIPNCMNIARNIPCISAKNSKHPFLMMFPATSMPLKLACVGSCQRNNDRWSCGVCLGCSLRKKQTFQHSFFFFFFSFLPFFNGTVCYTIIKGFSQRFINRKISRSERGNNEILCVSRFSNKLLNAFSLHCCWALVKISNCSVATTSLSWWLMF